MAQLHVLMGAESVRRRPVIRKIGLADLKDALVQGLADFSATPSHAVFLCLIYPIVGLILARLTLGYDVLPLLFPLASGFALVGPFAAIGFYELSRRRELGLPVSWQDAFDVFRSPSRDAIAALALLGVVARNPVMMALWGLIVAALLLIGSLPLFFGLAVVVPVLGHATWHLYRKVVEPDFTPRPELPRPPRRRHYAAQFPAAIF